MVFLQLVKSRDGLNFGMDPPQTGPDISGSFVWRTSLWAQNTLASSQGRASRFTKSQSHLEQLTNCMAEPTLQDNLNQMTSLCRNRQYSEACGFINEMSSDRLLDVLKSLSVSKLIEDIPKALPILESIYRRVLFFFDSNPTYRNVCKGLDIDRFVRRWIAWFAALEQHRFKYPEGHFAPLLKSALNSCFYLDPAIKHKLSNEVQSLQSAVENLGLHGLVECSDHRLVDLMEAIRSEMTGHFQKIKNVNQKFTQLCNNYNKPTPGIIRNVTRRSSSMYYSQTDVNELYNNLTDQRIHAPSDASHQRLTQLSLSEVKSRLSRNELALELVLATTHCQELQSLSQILQRRVHLDKEVLQCCNSLIRSQSGETVNFSLLPKTEFEEVELNRLLLGYISAYRRVLSLMQNSIDHSSLDSSTNGHQPRSFTDSGKGSYTNNSSGSSSEGHYDLVDPQIPKPVSPFSAESTDNSLGSEVTPTKHLLRPVPGRRQQRKNLLLSTPNFDYFQSVQNISTGPQRVIPKSHFHLTEQQRDSANGASPPEALNCQVEENQLSAVQKLDFGQMPLPRMRSSVKNGDLNTTRPTNQFASNQNMPHGITQKDLLISYNAQLAKLRCNPEDENYRPRPDRRSISSSSEKRSSSQKRPKHSPTNASLTDADRLRAQLDQLKAELDTAKNQIKELNDDNAK